MMRSPTCFKLALVRPLVFSWIFFLAPIFLLGFLCDRETISQRRGNVSGPGPLSESQNPRYHKVGNRWETANYPVSLRSLPDLHT